MNETNEINPKALQCPQCGAGLPPNPTGSAICQYCGSSVIWNLTGNQSAQAQESVVRGLRLKAYSAFDREGTGLEVFRMLAPVGWEMEGGVRWLLDNPGMPAAVSFRLHNPQGAEAFEVLPAMNFVWNNSPVSRLMFPVGSRYFGAEVRPPVGFHEAFHSFILPRYRSMVTGLQILKEEPQPDLPRLVKSEAALSGGSAEGGKVRIRYAWQGFQFEEEIYTVVEVYRLPVASMFSANQLLFWLINSIFSFRAAAERLDATANIFKPMIGSFRINPNWSAAYRSIVQRLAQQQIQRIHNIGQIGQMYAQAGREMREQNLSDWYSRQDTYDRLATERSRQIRDVDAYLDPHSEQVVELPAGYGNAWANDLGEYILSEDTSFNPNLFSNQHWEAMPQQ